MHLSMDGMLVMKRMGNTVKMYNMNIKIIALMQRSLLLSDIAPIITRSMIGTNNEKVVLIVGIIACLPIFLQ